MDASVLATYFELAIVCAAILTVVPVLAVMVATSCANMLNAARRGLLSLPAERSTPRPERAPDFAHLPGDLAAFGRATFSMLEELEHFRRMGGDASTRKTGDRTHGWLRQIGGALGNPSAELAEARTAREVWQWVILAEALDATRREDFGLLGDAHTRVRDALTSSSSLRSRLPSIVPELTQIAESLARYSAADYRGLRLRSIGPAPSVVDDETTADDLPKRHRRFREVEEKYTPLLARIATQYASTSADHDDLLQEIKLAIWNALPAFRGESSLRTYVVRIAYNRAASALRRRSPKPMFVEEPRWAELDIENHLLQQERRGWLRRAVDHLPEGVAEAIRLRMDGASYKEIAGTLGITTTNVGVRLHAGRARLRALAIGEQQT